MRKNDLSQFLANAENLITTGSEELVIKAANADKSGNLSSTLSILRDYLQVQANGTCTQLHPFILQLGATSTDKELNNKQELKVDATIIGELIQEQLIASFSPTLVVEQRLYRTGVLQAASYRQWRSHLLRLASPGLNQCFGESQWETPFQPDTSLQDVTATKEVPLTMPFQQGNKKGALSFGIWHLIGVILDPQEEFQEDELFFPKADIMERFTRDLNNQLDGLIKDTQLRALAISQPSRAVDYARTLKAGIQLDWQSRGISTERN